MIEYKIVNTELERVMLGAVDGKLASCHADGGINANKLGNYYWGKELKLKILQKEGLI